MRRCRKTEKDAYRESPPTETPVKKASDEKNGQQNRKTVKKIDCNM